MIVRNLKNSEELFKAIKKVNRKYRDNIEFNYYPVSLNQKNTSFKFTLRVKNSHERGSRLGFPRFTGFNSAPDYAKRRHLINACWHVHGDFFDALFAVNPEATIISRGNKITSSYGNWDDFDIGSQVNPYYMSEACECDKWGNRGY